MFLNRLKIIPIPGEKKLKFLNKKKILIFCQAQLTFRGPQTIAIIHDLFHSSTPKNNFYPCEVILPPWRMHAIRPKNIAPQTFHHPDPF